MLVQIAQPALIFDLRDDAGFGAQIGTTASQHQDVFAGADERERDEIDPRLDPDANVALSFSVREGRFTSTPGRLMCRREPSLPGVTT